MSTIKNFGLAGLSTDVQLGKGGDRLQSSGGAFLLRNAADSSYVTLAVAAPTSDEHATTRLFVNTGLGATRTGVGLNTGTGAYTANASSNYITGATSVINSIDILDATANDIQGELDTTQTGAGLNATGSYTAPGASNYLGTATSLKDADDKLDTVMGNMETASGFTGTGSLPAWSGTNYVTSDTSLVGAITTLDVQTKSNADNIAALGNAFNYIGTLAGGADTGSAYDLSTLAANQKNPGDYFKVSTAGYFKDTSGGTEYYANIGDGLVKNTTADGWDIIDNTDSTVGGTADRISVTGSPDTGYTVDIATGYVGQTSITTLGTIGTGTWSADTIAVNKGGTGITSYTQGDIVVASGATTLTKLAKGAANQVLQMDGSGANLAWSVPAAEHISLSTASITATDVKGALEELDARIDASLSDEILSPDGYTSVKTTDATGVQFFDEVAASKTEVLRLTGTATAVTLSAQSSGSNSDVKLAPKGTGSVDVSSAKIINLAAPSADTDALNLGTAKAAFTHYAVADITEANANVAIGGINGVVLRVIVYLSDAFDTGSTLTIGYTGTTDALAAASDIEHDAAGIYVIDNVSVINETVNAYITGTGTGAGKVIIEYLAV